MRWLLRLASTQIIAGRAERGPRSQESAADQARAQPTGRCRPSRRASGALADGAPAAEDLEHDLVADEKTSMGGGGDRRADLLAIAAAKRITIHAASR